jgi:hypothetical protein
VRDQPRAGFVEQSQRFSGSYRAGIGVPSATVVAGRTVLDVVFGLRKRRKPVFRTLRGLRTLRGQRGGQKAENKQSEKLLHDKDLLNDPWLCD